VSGRFARSGGPGPWLEPLGLFALALGVRLLPWPAVFEGGRVVLFENDSFYHLRRIVYSLVHFPEALRFDPYLHFPEGAVAIWPVAFDWCAALLLRPFAPELRTASAAELLPVERLAVFLPPLLGAAAVVALYRLACREFDRAVARAAALLLCVLPAHFWYSQLAFLDHHVAEALTALLLLGAGMGLLRAHSRGGEPPGRAALRAGGAGLALAGCLLVWPGSLLHVALVESAWLAYLATRPQRGPALRFAGSFAAANASAALLLAPFGLGSAWPQWGPLSPVVLSGFQPWLFGTLALLGLAGMALERLPRTGGSPGRRCAALAGAGALLLGASLCFWPGLREGAGQAWRWLARAEAFQSQVAESEPLLWVGGRLSFEVALLRLSGLGLLFPLLLAGVAWWVRHERHRAPPLLLLWVGAGLFAATLAQRRFFNALAAPLALVAGYGLCALARSLPAPWLEGPARRRRARIAVAGLGLVLLAPALETYAPYLARAVARLRGEPVRRPVRELTRLRMQEVAAFLGSATPPTAGWLDPRGRPEYGVLAPWPLGHRIQYLARRPTVLDAFGDDLGGEGWARGQRYFASAEAEAAQLLEALRVRYVVVGEGAGAGSPEELPRPDSMLVSLSLFDGSEPPPGAARRSGGRALERHRLIFESGPAPLSSDRAAYKVFELVPGARIEGRAAPGARIEVSLPLRTNRGRALRFQAAAAADAAGRYRLRVPYASRGQPAAVRVGAAYALRCGGERAQVAVEEEAVRRGALVAGPELCLGGAEKR